MTAGTAETSRPEDALDETEQQKDPGNGEAMAQQETSICVICQYGFTASAVTMELQCSHRFHAGCMQDYARSATESRRVTRGGVHLNCPICRATTTIPIQAAELEIHT